MHLCIILNCWTKPPNVGSKLRDWLSYEVKLVNDNHHEKKERLSDRFVRELEFRNYSPRTISSYLATLVQLSRHYKQSPADITIEQVKKYLYYCKEERGLSNSFINQAISAVKILKQDVLGQGWGEGIKIKRPRRNHHLPDILSKQEIASLIDVTPNPKHKAIIAVLHTWG